ncbi:unnamed protein product [Caenorhabditis auriculariae]|uniref:Uncharacterized protein n=1 Tax=Caenorhabditis auriculariae TaxID=2777116 RepID=A0A8S1HAP3_9PELO|nr:unnamed protein product [Caenorhabditis auriculariae]
MANEDLNFGPMIPCTELKRQTSNTTQSVEGSVQPKDKKNDSKKNLDLARMEIKKMNNLVTFTKEWEKGHQRKADIADTVIAQRFEGLILDLTTDTKFTNDIIKATYSDIQTLLDVVGTYRGLSQQLKKGRHLAASHDDLIARIAKNQELAFGIKDMAVRIRKRQQEKNPAQICHGTKGKPIETTLSSYLVRTCNGLTSLRHQVHPKKVTSRFINEILDQTHLVCTLVFREFDPHDMKTYLQALAMPKAQKSINSVGDKTTTTDGSSSSEED